MTDFEPTNNAEYDATRRIWIEGGCDAHKAECEGCAKSTKNADVIETACGWYCTTCAKSTDEGMSVADEHYHEARQMGLTV